MNISVIIPTYQHADTITDCLDSVLNQTLLPFEVIVVNDGSTDNTLKVLEPYRDRITLINQENRGANPTRNRGFEASSGNRIIFCDADVIMRSDMLETLSEALDRHPEASYAYGSFRFGWKRFAGGPFDPERLKQRNYIHTSSLIRREDFPGFDPAIKRLQDWDVWLTMLENGHTGVFVDKELFRVILPPGREGISQWRPKYLYRIPWPIFGWTPKSILRYQEAAVAIKEKHQIA